MAAKFYPYLMLGLCWFAPTTARSQQAPGSEWLGLTVPVALGGKWQFNPEIGYRTYTSEFQRLQNFFRFNFRYRFNDFNNLASGGAFFTTRLSLDEHQKEFGSELRWFEEGNHILKISEKLNLQQRLRLEQRFFQATTQYSAHLAHRFRFLINTQYQLHSKWQLNLSSEYMEALQYSRFKLDQWRMISFLSFLPSNKLQLNLGYFYIIRSAYRQNVFILTLFKSFGVHESRQHSS